MVELGKLERVEDLNAVWKHEAHDFTPWLQGNIDLLAESLDLDIQLTNVEREVPIGAFALDLLGEEVGSNRPVIIENQLTLSDHTHLGQLLTYAAGKKGGVIIWVAKQIRSEHQTALEWLNDATQGNIDFYGVEIQLLKIGTSEIAPNFNVVVAPKLQEVTKSPLGIKGQEYNKFFADLLGRIKSRQPSVSNKSKVGSTSWLSTASGKAGFSFGFAFTKGNAFQIELYIDRGDRQVNKHAYDQIEQRRVDVEEELGAALDWQRLDNRRACRIAWPWNQSVTILDAAHKLEELKQWAVDSYFSFRRAFSRALEDLEPIEQSDTSPGSEG